MPKRRRGKKEPEAPPLLNNNNKATEICNDFSVSNASEEEKKSKKSNCGFIFMCNGRTKPQCYLYRVFGLPKHQLQALHQIKAGSNLFLFDFDLKLLYGVYKATSTAALNLEPNAFQAKFPAQVRFKIFKECFPLPERNFKAAIIDNYHGSRFNQLLTSAQVKALMSLFRPLTSTAPTSYVPLPPLLNVSRLHSFPSHIMQERFHQPPASLPYPEYTYLSSVHHIPASQLPDTRQKQVAAPPPPLHGRYELVASVQPPIEHTRVVQHPALPHNADSYYVPDANKPYLHEKSSLYSQHPYNRYSSELEMVPGDPVVEYAHDYVIPQLPKEGENNIVPRADYVAEYHGQHLPTVTSHNSLHSHVLPQSYTQPLPDHPQAEPPVFHEPYYPVSTHENLSQVHTDPLQRLLPGSSEANVAVPSHFLFGGGAPTYH